MNKPNNEIVLLEKIRNLFKKQESVNKEDLGVYHYIWSCDTFNEESNGMRFDVYAKIKVVETYSELVEVEMINLKINDSASQDIINIITNNFPKYINPNKVKWIIKTK